MTDFSKWKHRDGVSLKHLTHSNGFAFCQELKVLAISNTQKNIVHVYDMSEGVGCLLANSLKEVAKLGDRSCAHPMQFEFFAGQTGYLAFTNGSTPLLLVSDARFHSVHFIDISTQRHMGFLAPPGSLLWPRMVATKCSLAAVAFTDYDGGKSEVKIRIFEQDDALEPTKWGARYTVFISQSPIACVGAIQITMRGRNVLVADSRIDAIWMIHIPKADDSASASASALHYEYVGVGALTPYSMAEMADGSVFCAGATSIEFVDEDERNYKLCSLPKALLCSVPADNIFLAFSVQAQKVYMYGHARDMKLATMSFSRTAWMSAVIRGIFLAE